MNEIQRTRRIGQSCQPKKKIRAGTRYGQVLTARPAVAVYPDSGKVLINAPGFQHRGWLGQPVDYWEGEE